MAGALAGADPAGGAALDRLLPGRLKLTEEAEGLHDPSERIWRSLLKGMEFQHSIFEPRESPSRLRTCERGKPRASELWTAVTTPSQARCAKRDSEVQDTWARSPQGINVSLLRRAPQILQG